MKQLLITAIAAVLLVGVVSVIAESEPKVLLMHTPDGIEFGIWGRQNGCRLDFPRDRPRSIIYWLHFLAQHTFCRSNDSSGIKAGFFFAVPRPSRGVDPLEY